MNYPSFTIENYGRIYSGDCLEIMPALKAEGVKADLILTDLPYGTTHCKWDTVIDLNSMWNCINEISYPATPVLLFAQQPFTTTLVNSNIKNFRYHWIWEKTTATGHLNAKRMPMKAHEEVLVFYKKQPFYNPIKTSDHKRKIITAGHKAKCNQGSIYNPHTDFTDYDSTERYPRSVLKYKTDKQLSCYHSAQKPVALLEYFIQTYTKEGGIVLDFTMGSGSTGIACKNTGRKFIGIEKDETIYQTAKERLIYATE